ncbi:MAG TPA: AMP-dependent synthetase [Sphingobium sp.]|uniref:class I adenylate-forming enzyme family protein n=1 Tax=Sphingobium sp. TaxID=1912891 RepID=UPI000EE1CFCF|nr:AMP-binding protein [Sphingobium sp.]HAF41403.1 AMP-dependent synthetase [Sphingobium sp.]
MRAIDYFDRGHDRDPERPCLIDAESGETLSFAQVGALTRRIAVALHAAGFRDQQPIALYGPNSAIMMVALLAIWRANGQWVPVNTRNAIDANAAYLDYVSCGWLFYHSSQTKDVAALKARVPSLSRFVCLDRAQDGDPSLDQFVANCDVDSLPDFSDPFGKPDDIVGLFPTGGTTGPSKGVVVTNLGWGTMVETLAAAVDGRTDTPVSLVVAPITHAAGPVALATLSLGAAQVILPGFDAAAVLDAIERHGITHVYMPPTALYSLLDAPELPDSDTRSLKIFLLVGSPVSPEKLRRAVQFFGPCLCQAYGQVESPMIVTWLSPEDVAAAAAGDRPERLASCGRPTRPVTVAIMDEDGNLLPDGETGELVVRGVLVSREYYEMPQATAEIRTHGWHHTGDIARCDADGYLYIVDRKKDMVVSGGFNVFTAEVEAALTELPQVRECAVIGIPHEKWGEAVHAIVVADNIGETEIIAHAKARLGGVKAPKSVAFVPSIPRTAAGKMDKKALRAAWWTGARMVN